MHLPDFKPYDYIFFVCRMKELMTVASKPRDVGKCEGDMLVSCDAARRVHSFPKALITGVFQGRCMRFLSGMLRAGVVLVRRLAGLYMFILVIAVGMTVVTIAVKDGMPSAADMKMAPLFKDGSNDLANARKALHARGFEGCVYHKVEHKATQVVCGAPALKLVEVLLVLMLALGKCTAALAHAFLTQGLSCIVLRYAFDTAYRYAGRKREEALRRDLNQYPYYTV